MKRIQRSVDLTPAFIIKRYYKEPPKRYGLWGTLILSNVLWAGLFIFLASILVVLSKSASTMASSYLQERWKVSQIKESVSKEIEERDLKIARLIQYQSSSSTDVLTLARKISGVLDSAPTRHRDFFEKAVPEAMHLQVTQGIPASAIIAMAIYESGYGRSMLASQHNNYFGIKAFNDWKGPRAKSMPTRDLGVLTTADFRAYRNMGESFEGYVSFLKQNPRYKDAFKKRSGAEFVAAILKAGYCPDSNYYANIIDIMQRHQLAELDETIQTTTGTSLLASKEPASSRREVAKTE